MEVILRNEMRADYITGKISAVVGARRRRYCSWVKFENFAHNFNELIDACITLER